MTEIRPIRDSESDQFLELLCDVFALDFNRAYSLFREEPMFDLNRKWALFEGQEMISILTTTPLQFGWGNAIGIAGVATRVSRQGEGYAGKLIRKVLKASEDANEGAALLFASDLRLYETLGFEGLDRVVSGQVATLPIEVDSREISFDQLRNRYDQWASGHADRLIRDQRRWQYWQWNLRECRAVGEGYLCLESGIIREALLPDPMSRLPVSRGTEWLGTSFMTDQLDIPLGTVTVPMYLLGYRFPGLPQFFMTDQF